MKQSKLNTVKPEQNKSHLISSLKTLAALISSSLIILIAFRNTLTWYFQRFWGASAELWQSYWDQILYLFNYNEFLLFTVGTFLVSIVVYWGVGGFYTFVDFTGKPSFLLKYKIQDPNVNNITLKALIPLMKQILYNQIFVGIPFIFFGYFLTKLRGSDTSPNLPTFHWVLFELAIFAIIEEFGFYYSHRILHHSRVYKHIHKRHHEWTAPIAITAIYCHPIEHMLSNLVPVFAGPFIMGSHLSTTWLWFTIAQIFTLNAHCGFHFPLMPSPEAHDFHHLKFNQNYGVFGFLDRFHDTDKMFRKSKAYDRHIMLMSLVPIKELIPEVKAGKSDFE